MGTVGAPNIVTDELVMTIDAGSPTSYPGSGTTIYNTAPYLDNDGYGQQRLALTADIDGASFNSGTQPSWVFDGTNDFINFGSSAFQYQNDDDFSLEVWFKPDDTSGFQHLIGITYASYRFAMSGTALSFRLDSNNLIIGGGSISAGNWQQAVATWNSFASQAVNYLNGVQVSSGTDATADWTSQGTNFQLGNSPGESYYFDGEIAIGRVYGKTLTSNEVLQNYRAIEPRFFN